MLSIYTRHELVTEVPATFTTPQPRYQNSLAKFIHDTRCYYKNGWTLLYWLLPVRDAPHKRSLLFLAQLAVNKESQQELHLEPGLRGVPYKINQAAVDRVRRHYFQV